MIYPVPFVPLTIAIAEVLYRHWEKISELVNRMTNCQRLLCGLLPCEKCH